MGAAMTRDEAWALLNEYNKDTFHLKHAVTVEGVMRWYADKLGYSDEADFWGIVGLLHDLDFEMFPEHRMEKVLYAVDELTGLIGAAALMRPSKSVQDMELKSVKKKYKSPNFAAGCSREVIERGAELMGVSLDELISDTMLAMRSCEDEYNKFV